jgi:hypothetical protein
MKNYTNILLCGIKNYWKWLDFHPNIPASTKARAGPIRSEEITH